MRAYAFDVRDTSTDALVGVGVAIPSERHIGFMANGGGSDVRTLSPELWDELCAWTAEGDAHLPGRPAPLNPRIVEALLGTNASTLIAQRFAVLPATAVFLEPTATAKLLSVLLTGRQSA